MDIYIVACQRGGVSNKPPGLQTATRHGARDPLVRSQLDKTLHGLTHIKHLNIANLVIATYKKNKKNGPYIRDVLLRQGEPGTSQYIHSEYFICRCRPLPIGW